MSDELSLFNAPAEPSGDYKVPGLRAHGDTQAGPWLQVWAEAPLALHGLQDREAVMRARGLDPDAFEIHPPKVFNKLADGTTRTWWYCWPKTNPAAE